MYPLPKATPPARLFTLLVSFVLGATACGSPAQEGILSYPTDTDDPTATHTAEITPQATLLETATVGNDAPPAHAAASTPPTLAATVPDQAPTTALSPSQDPKNLEEALQIIDDRFQEMITDERKWSVHNWQLLADSIAKAKQYAPGREQKRQCDTAMRAFQALAKAYGNYLEADEMLETAAAQLHAASEQQEAYNEAREQKEGAKRMTLHASLHSVQKAVSRLVQGHQTQCRQLNRKCNRALQDRERAYSRQTEADM